MIQKNVLHATLLVVIDTITLIALFYVSILLREALDFGSIPLFKVIHLEDFLFAIITVLILLMNEKIYVFRYDFWQETRKIIKALAISYLLTLTLLALMKTNEEYSRLFISIYFVLAIILVPLFRRFIKQALYSFSFFSKKVLVLGNEAQKNRLIQEFKSNFYLGQQFTEHHYDSVLIISKGMEVEKLNQLIEQYTNTKEGLYIIPYVDNINFAHSTIIEYSNIQNNSIFIENRLLVKRNILIKSLFDKSISLIFLPFFLLIHLVLSILIKLDSKGKVLYKQLRLGKDNQNFLCYKYRTMYENGDTLLAEYLTKHPQEVSYYHKYHKYQNDPRITPIGKLLRASSLDELPQIINVLKGEMSLVGPRPYMLNEAKKIGEKQKFILKVKPGITGLWQVSGRNNLSFEERNELEVWYIKNWFLWDDFVILIKTFKVVFMKIGVK